MGWENLTNEYAIVCDFDGTVTVQDSNNLLCEEFGDEKNQLVEEQYRSGEIGTKEGMRRHFELISISEQDYVNFMRSNLEIDDGFKDFYRKVTEYNIPFIIVSGGFINCIETVFEREGISVEKVFANRLIFDGANATIKFFQDMEDCGSGFGVCGNCKMRYIKEFQAMGRKVIFIGDGLTDRCGANESDIVFAKNELEGYCIEKGIPYIKYNNFRDIMRSMNEVSLPGI